VRLAREFASWVDADADFERVAPVEFSVVNYRCKSSDEANRRILEIVNGGGEFFISSTVLQGRFTLHLAIGNHQTTAAHVRRVWECIRAARLQAQNEP
jgi:aromatic-L-amino-acid decarboxylase